MNVRYRVELSQAERSELTALLSGGKHSARKLKRAQILLAADAGGGDEQIARNVGVGGSTVYRTKQRFVLGNLEAALSEEPRPGASRKLSGKEEALLVATACSKPPAGRARWTLELLAGELVRLTEHEDISRETVRRRLADNDLKPWRKDMWCIPQVDGEYVARMEDVLDLYAEAPDPQAPGGLFRREPDPTHRRGSPADPGRAGPERALRLRVQAQRDRQPVRLPRRAPSLAQGQSHRQPGGCGLRRLHARTRRYPLIPRPSASGSFSTICRPTRPARSTRPSPPARRGGCLRRLEFHYVPKHASWLNMVEIEIGVLRGQCLDRRIVTKQQLVSEIAAWERQRNASWQPASNGCSQPRKPAPKWAAPIPTRDQRVIITVQRY